MANVSRPVPGRPASRLAGPENEKTRQDFKAQQKKCKRAYEEEKKGTEPKFPCSKVKIDDYIQFYEAPEPENDSVLRIDLGECMAFKREYKNYNELALSLEKDIKLDKVEGLNEFTKVDM